MGFSPGEAIPETGYRRDAQDLSRWKLWIAGKVEACRVQLREAGQGARTPTVPAQGGPMGKHPNPGSRRKESIPRALAPAGRHVEVEVWVEVKVWVEVEMLV